MTEITKAFWTWLCEGCDKEDCNEPFKECEALSELLDNLNEGVK